MKIQALRARFTVSSVNLILLLEIATVVPPCRAEAPNMHDAEFRTFYAQFSKAVRANDKNKIADLIAFPVKDWSVERKGNVETISIPTKAEFLRKYDSLFTPFMRAHVLKTKPQKISDDHYAAIWRDSNAEFSFQFENVGGRGFRITAYGIGPW
jgi:hypothetical protein